MGRVDVHRCKFNSWRPSEITCFAKNDEQEIVAVGRSDSTVELWSTQYNFNLITRIGGTKYSNKILSLEWFKYEGRHRLIVVTSTHLMQWDLETLHMIQSLGSVGGDITAFSFNKETLTAATGAGSLTVHLYSIDAHKNGMFVYSRAMSKIMAGAQSTNIQCMQWVNARLLLVATDSQLLSFDVTTAERKMEVDCTNCTAMCVVDSSTVVLGHVNGIVSFHEIKYGSTIQEFKNHIAAIRTIQVTKDHKSIFISGDDPTITRISSNKGGKWALNGLRRVHTHDVRTIQVFDDFIMSGGVSTTINVLSCSSSNNMSTAKNTNYYSYPQHNVAMADIEVAETEQEQSDIISVILESNKSSLSLWKLGRHETDSEIATSMPSGSHLPVVERAKKLMAFEVKEKEYIRAIDISSDGRYFAYCTSASANIYSIELINKGERIVVHKIKSFDNGYDIIKFTSQQQQQQQQQSSSSSSSTPILVLSSNSSLTIYNIENEEVKKIKKSSTTVTLNTNINNTDVSKSNNNSSSSSSSPATLPNIKLTTLQLAVDSSGTYAATVDSRYNVNFFNLAKGVWTINIPSRLHCSAIAFHPVKPLLYIANSEEVVVFNARLLKTVHMTSAPRHEAVTAIITDPSDPNRMILWSHDSMSVADWDNFTCYDVKNGIFPNSIIACSSPQLNQLVTFELPYDQLILPSLPPAIKLKIFGEN